MDGVFGVLPGGCGLAYELLDLSGGEFVFLKEESGFFI